MSQDASPAVLANGAVQISEQIWFGVKIIRGLYAIGGLRENRVGLGSLPIAFPCGPVHPGLTSWVILSTVLSKLAFQIG
jgi:hypothetical protein